MEFFLGFVVLLGLILNSLLFETNLLFKKSDLFLHLQFILNWNSRLQLNTLINVGGQVYGLGLGVKGFMRSQVMTGTLVICV